MTSSRSQYQELLDLIRQRQADFLISDEQFAATLGYERVQTFTMTRDGRLKLPFTKIPALASALAIDPVHTLQVVLAETMPDVLSTIELIAPYFLARSF